MNLPTQSERPGKLYLKSEFGWGECAGDLALEIDFGRNQPGAILQRKVKGEYQDYLIDGKPVVNPFTVETLPPGFYRLRVP